MGGAGRHLISERETKVDPAERSEEYTLLDRIDSNTYAREWAVEMGTNMAACKPAHRALCASHRILHFLCLI